MCRATGRPGGRGPHLAASYRRDYLRYLASEPFRINVFDFLLSAAYPMLDRVKDISGVRGVCQITSRSRVGVILALALGKECHRA